MFNVDKPALSKKKLSRLKSKANAYDAKEKAFTRGAKAIYLGSLSVLSVLAYFRAEHVMSMKETYGFIGAGVTLSAIVCVVILMGCVHGLNRWREDKFKKKHAPKYSSSDLSSLVNQKDLDRVVKMSEKWPEIDRYRREIIENNRDITVADLKAMKDKLSAESAKEAASYLKSITDRLGSPAPLAN